MQDVVRHDDQVRGVQPIADRCDERGMKLAKMRLGRRLQLRGERADIVRPETELRELELQQPQEVPYLA